MAIPERSAAHPPPCAELSFGIQAGGAHLQAKTILPPGTGLTGPGPTLVFLHEGLGSITQWRSFPLALARATGLPVLLYDRHGHGRSAPRTGPPDPGYLAREACECLPEVLATVGIEAPILVGHSDGATIALLYAARFPRSPLAVVAEAGHVFVEALTLQGIWRTLRAYETTQLRDQLARHHGAAVDAMFRAWCEVWLSPPFRDWNILDQLPAILCPVLVVQGEADPYGTLDQVQAIFTGVSGPVQGLVLPCGHVPHLEAVADTLDGITRFLHSLDVA
jgi:pimeloyl-ACP methyl ester carboxylesterase